MPTGLILIGLGCGALLAAGGLALAGGFHRVAGLPLAVLIVRWLSAGLLAVGALLVFLESPDLALNALSPVLMASLAALPTATDRHLRPWCNAAGIVPALALAWAGFFHLALGNAAPSGTSPEDPIGPMTTLAVIICGGLGARVLGLALAKIVDPHVPIERWSWIAAYTLLTVLAISVAAANLWQRGSVWKETSMDMGMVGLAGAWLAWNAARVRPGASLRLHAGLTGLAALYLVVVAAGV